MHRTGVFDVARKVRLKPAPTFAEIPFRIGAKTLEAARRAEVVGLTLVLGATGRAVRCDRHPAHGIDDLSCDGLLRRHPTLVGPVLRDGPPVLMTRVPLHQLRVVCAILSEASDKDVDDRGENDEETCMDLRHRHDGGGISRARVAAGTAAAAGYADRAAVGSRTGALVGISRTGWATAG